VAKNFRRLMNDPQPEGHMASYIPRFYRAVRD
jgi:hypothetical protein